ncbi:Heterokaryon incompatibility protein 6, OR allele [Cytospora mali]|uniref:Heterokaryon incompatibility protein 6, OR allele n=1 Tax=Cytospora mali TaxID=578113 RepID=A0A194V3G7_CYTMA|nr:Heterokaryon incompatibility protein 6, OR allele [Valsa mali var. pyri (nom. inval.)]
MAPPGGHVPGYQYHQLEKEKRTIPSGIIRKYTALSYTWGTSRRNIPILVNGANLDITASLRDALRHLKNIQEQGDFPFYWWIDMICINQEDDSERGHQVGMMRHIFRDARVVVAWLGGTNCDERGETFLQYIQKVSQSTYPKALVELSDEVSDGCWALLGHPWWSRLWIIQEVLVAREVMIACRDVIVSWAILRLFVRHLEVISPGLPNKMALNLTMLRDENQIRLH